MSDLSDYLNENSGTINAFSQYTAITQRRQQIARQKDQTDAIRAQTRALEEQNHLEQDRVILEKQRLAAEESERKQRHLEDKQLKQVRRLMVDCIESLERLKVIRPAPACSQQQ